MTREITNCLKSNDKAILPQQDRGETEKAGPTESLCLESPQKRSLWSETSTRPEWSEAIRRLKFIKTKVDKMSKEEKNISANTGG